jgi:hypothetical protein
MDRSLRFAKRFFYFSEEPVAAKNLSTYLQAEKSAAGAQKTAAWATQTGSGLLFYAKRAEDKATPASIFNLVGSEYQGTITRPRLTRRSRR